MIVAPDKKVSPNTSGSRSVQLPESINVQTLRTWLNPVNRWELASVGVDPGLEHTAAAVVRRDGQRYAVMGTMYLRTKPNPALGTMLDIGARCRGIASAIWQFLQVGAWTAGYVCIEGWTYTGPKQRVTSQSMATPRIIGTTEGILLVRGVAHGEMPTLKIKQRIGVSRSRNGDPKKRVRAATERLTGFEAKNEHERDAIAAAIAGWAEVGR